MLGGSTGHTSIITSGPDPAAMAVCTLTLYAPAVVPSAGAVQISTPLTAGLVLGNSIVQRLTVSARIPVVQSVESESFTGALLLAGGLAVELLPQAATARAGKASPL